MFLFLLRCEFLQDFSVQIHFSVQLMLHTNSQIIEESFLVLFFIYFCGKVKKEKDKDWFILCIPKAHRLHINYPSALPYWQDLLLTIARLSEKCSAVYYLRPGHQWPVVMDQTTRAKGPFCLYFVTRLFQVCSSIFVTFIFIHSHTEMSEWRV